MKKKKFALINNNSLMLSSSNYYNELQKLDLEIFPLIEDFIIDAYYTKTLGYHIYYSNSNNILCGFPWWDNAEIDIKTMTIENIPIGTINNPYDDLEQSWQILIFRKGKYVYVLQGDDPCTIEFNIWFKIPYEDYINQWSSVLNDFA